MRFADSLLVPLGAYLAITLVLPLANGAAARRGAAFWHHALVVLAACAVVAAIGIRRRRSRVGGSR